MKILVVIFSLICLISPANAFSDIMVSDSLVKQFYARNGGDMIWLSSHKGTKRAYEWLDAIEVAKAKGQVSQQLMTGEIRSAIYGKIFRSRYYKQHTDEMITTLVLNYLKELQTVKVPFDYDGISSQQSDSVYLQQLLASGAFETVTGFVSRFNIKDHNYLVLEKYLRDSVQNKNSIAAKAIKLSMNYLKFIYFHKQPTYIVANIAETRLYCCRNDSLVLNMKTVVGKVSSPTPTIASNITTVVTFPFWNVPFSIATKELLPKVQKDESYLEKNNFAVVDAKGNPVDDSELNWSAYTANNFPYFFRESTGPNNSLGVLKFNLANPFSIYLHDTNVKSGFARKNRFASHGCVRLEKPVELAEILTNGRIDVNALKIGKKDTESKTIRLTANVPVFIVYMPVIADGEKVAFLKDPYGLVK